MNSKYGDRAGVVVLVGGFLAPRSDPLTKCYWGEALNTAPSNWRVIVVHPSPVASLHDRACQVFWQLKGERHLARSNPATPNDDANSFQPETDNSESGARQKGQDDGLFPEWDAVHPVHMVGHSLGGNTIRVMLQLMREGQFDQCTPQSCSPSTRPSSSAASPWVRSVTTLCSPLNGAPTVYGLGGDPHGTASVRWGSGGFALSALIACVEGAKAVAPGWLRQNPATAPIDFGLGHHFQQPSTLARPLPLRALRFWWGLLRFVLPWPFSSPQARAKLADGFHVFSSEANLAFDVQVGACLRVNHRIAAFALSSSSSPPSPASSCSSSLSPPPPSLPTPSLPTAATSLSSSSPTSVASSQALFLSFSGGERPEEERSRRARGRRRRQQLLLEDPNVYFFSVVGSTPGHNRQVELKKNTTRQVETPPPRQTPQQEQEQDQTTSSPPLSVITFPTSPPLSSSSAHILAPHSASPQSSPALAWLLKCVADSCAAAAVWVWAMACMHAASVAALRLVTWSRSSLVATTTSTPATSSTTSSASNDSDESNRIDASMSTTTTDTTATFLATTTTRDALRCSGKTEGWNPCLVSCAKRGFYAGLARLEPPLHAFAAGSPESALVEYFSSSSTAPSSRPPAPHAGFLTGNGEGPSEDTDDDTEDDTEDEGAEEEEEERGNDARANDSSSSLSSLLLRAHDGVCPGRSCAYPLVLVPPQRNQHPFLEEEDTAAADTAPVVSSGFWLKQHFSGSGGGGGGSTAATVLGFVAVNLNRADSRWCSEGKACMRENEGTTTERSEKSSTSEGTEGGSPAPPCSPPPRLQRREKKQQRRRKLRPGVWHYETVPADHLGLLVAPACRKQQGRFFRALYKRLEGVDALFDGGGDDGDGGTGSGGTVAKKKKKKAPVYACLPPPLPWSQALNS